MDSLWDLNELLNEKVDEIVKKGDMSPTELDCVYKATKAMYYITGIDAMEGADEYEGSSMARGMSRSYPYSSRRNSYNNSYRRSSRNSMRNYSGHDKKEMLMQRIAEIQDEIDRMEG